jgi:general secretion pathway protein C
MLAAVAAYFQASGIATLVGSAIAPPTLATAKRRLPRTSNDSEEEPSGKAILARNPFDSVTGPLSSEARGESAPARPPAPSDPLAVPKCEGVRVDATTESDDPYWSIAVIQGPKEPRGRVRRVGMRVAERTVAYIGFNPKKKSPAVWLSSEQGLCQSLLFDAAKKPPPPAAKRPPRPPPRKRPGAPPLAKSISDKIRALGDRRYAIDRSVVDVIVRDYSKLMRGVTVKPVLDKGRVAGLRIGRVLPSSLLGKLGLKNGDVLRSINGFPLSSPEKALQAYARLRTASEIEIVLDRGGKPTSIDLQIR